MCRMAPEVVIELEHMGMPFSRLQDGKIFQRRFGGHTKDFGKEAICRTCAAADRTGHAMLHTLYEQCVKNQVVFYNEFFALELLMNEGHVVGVLAWDIANGGFHIFHAKATMFATGGYIRVYKTNSNAHINTGDGLSLSLRAGLPVEDLEFVQFHPTCLYHPHAKNFLISEAVRGEGGRLIDKRGNAFMEKYHPLKDLAFRDVVARAIDTEMKRTGDDCVYLDISHRDAEFLKKRFPNIYKKCLSLGIDIIKDPIPVFPRPITCAVGSSRTCGPRRPLPTCMPSENAPVQVCTEPTAWPAIPSWKRPSFPIGARCTAPRTFSSGESVLTRTFPAGPRNCRRETAVRAR